jgi:hypothetical protein
MGAVKKQIKIKVKKKKKRVPIPQKPPKVINSKKTYNRKKVKRIIRKEENEE